MLKNDINNGNNYDNLNWAGHVKRILDEIGMTNIWLSQNAEHISLKTLKQRITDIYKQSWTSEIRNSNRLLSYSWYKNELTLERYIDTIQNNKFKIALTRFRLSSHDLMIEKGRHLNIPRNERLCTNCNMNVIENEYHFLLVCPKYNDLRKTYFSPYFCHWPTKQKFIALMSSESVKTIIYISKFVYYASRL